MNAMSQKRIIRIYAFLSVCFFLISTSISGSPDDTVRILHADNPLHCLSPESLFIDGDGYILIDGRNNLARVKYINSDGVTTKTAISTIPLPDAASLPCDILPSPWGIDRVVPASSGLWAVPAPYADAVAEHFDSATGEFIERLPNPGLRVSGLATGPDGDVWAIGQRLLLNIANGNALNLGANIRHIDTAVGHPLGFLIFEQPDLFLIETTGIIRWRIGLDGIIDGFLSPIDIATGPDGTIAICAVICDLSDPENHDEYFSIRNEALARDDENVLFAVEDALRANLGTGFALLLIEPDGTVTDAIEMNSVPIACAVDQNSRAHVLTQRWDNWGISILDPRLDEGFEVLEIPFGAPGMISPHRIVAGRDGSLYWDDIIAGEIDEFWGIGRLNRSGSGELFSLGTSDTSDEVEYLYTEQITDFIRRTTSLAVNPDSGLLIGYQEFSLIIPDESTDAIDEEPPYSSLVMSLDRNGNLLRNETTTAITGYDCSTSELFPHENGTIAVFTGTDMPAPVGFLGVDGSWSTLENLNITGPLGNGRIGEIKDGLIGWFLQRSDEEMTTRWLKINDDLDGSHEITLLDAINARFLESDPITDTIWVTIDDGEIFQLDASGMRVNGIWDNRLASGAVGHPLDDAVKVADGLAVLDREHRAIFLITPDAFTVPLYASDEDVNEAIALIRSALWGWNDMYGAYPPDSPDLLDNILTYSDREIVRRAFLGGRIYNYNPTDLGYTFTVWSAATDHPVLICDRSDIETIY